MSEWISVNDRLPETSNEYVHKSKPVIIIDKHGCIDITEYYWYCIDLGTVDNFIDDDITHWMPLPEPPKEA